MKFDDLDARMRVYETTHDRIIPLDVFPVVRLDGRGLPALAFLSCSAGWLVWTVGFPSRRLEGLSTEGKKALLAEFGIDFDQAPQWQRNGFGVYWETYEKQGLDPRTGESVSALRQRLRRDLELSTGEDYGRFVATFLNPSAL